MAWSLDGKKLEFGDTIYKTENGESIAYTVMNTNLDSVITLRGPDGASDEYKNSELSDFTIAPTTPSTPQSSSASTTETIGPVQDVSSTNSSVTEVLDSSSFRQGDIIEIGGNSYYVDGGDVSGGAYLRLIEDPNVITEAAKISDTSDRMEYLRENSTAGRITTEGFKESNLQTTTDMTGKNWNYKYSSSKTAGEITNDGEYVEGDDYATETSDPSVTTAKVTLNELADQEKGTSYIIKTNLGNGEREYLLTFGENGTYTLTDTNTRVVHNNVNLSNTEITLIDGNTRDYRGKSNPDRVIQASEEGYKNFRTNGLDSRDSYTVMDAYMHHAHTTPRATLSDTTYTTREEAIFIALGSASPISSEANMHKRLAIYLGSSPDSSILAK